MRSFDVFHSTLMFDYIGHFVKSTLQFACKCNIKNSVDIHLTYKKSYFHNCLIVAK